MAIVLITGGSGLIGRRLSLVLAQGGHTVRWLGRGPSNANKGYFNWDLACSIVDVDALTHVDHIVHLAGAGIADKRWTKARVQELIDSRAGSARLLLRAAREQGTMPKSLVSAAGVGYYGAMTGDHVFSENDPPGNDTIARISSDWESAVDEWSSHCRVVKLRTPLVLAREGGGLPKLVAPIRWGVGSAMGTGKQWLPWVHVHDLVRAYHQAIGDDRLEGAYNVVGGNATNAEIMRVAAKVLRKPFFLPNIPSAVLKLLFGEMADILLEGTRASSDRLLSTGFEFEYSDIDQALQGLLGSAPN